MLSHFEKFSTSIFVIYRYIHKIEADEMVKYGLKGSYVQYLTVMKRFPEGITAAQLCKLCDKNKAAVSRAISEMEEKAIITRNMESDNPYRARLVLTDAGKRAAEHVCEKAKRAVQEAGKGLDDEQRSVLYASLDLIANNLRSIAENGIPQD